MQPAFTHCAMHVRDLDQSIDFYRELLRLEIVKQHGARQGARGLARKLGEEDHFVLVLLGGGRRESKTTTT